MGKPKYYCKYCGAEVYQRSNGYKFSCDCAVGTSVEPDDYVVPTEKDVPGKPFVEFRDCDDDQWKVGRLIAIHPHDDPNAKEHNGQPDYYVETAAGNAETYPFLQCRMKRRKTVPELEAKIAQLRKLITAMDNALLSYEEEGPCCCRLDVEDVA